MPASCWWPCPEGGGYWLYWKPASLGRWWKWLITAKDCLIVDGEPLLWSAPQPEGLQSCLLTAAFSARDGFLFCFPRCWCLSSGRGGLRWPTAKGFSGAENARGDALTDCWGDTTFFLPAEWDWLVLERKPIQNESKIDVRGPPIPGQFGEHERRQRVCVQKRLIFCPSLSQPIPRRKKTLDFCICCEHITSPGVP